MGRISAARSIFTESPTYCVQRLKYIKGENRIPFLSNFLKGKFEKRL